MSFTKNTNDKLSKNAKQRRPRKKLRLMKKEKLSPRFKKKYKSFTT